MAKKAKKKITKYNLTIDSPLTVSHLAPKEFRDAVRKAATKNGMFSRKTKEGDIAYSWEQNK